MSIKCPHCGLEQHPRIVTRPDSVEYDMRYVGIEDDPHARDTCFVAYRDNDGHNWALAKCLRQQCEKIYLVTRQSKGNDWKTAIIIPSLGDDYPGDIPESVQSAIKQAQKCLAIDCSDAAAAMCRAALERVVKDKKANGKYLANKLEDLLNKGLLTKIVYDAADKVKDWGNTALHELLEEPVDRETVKKLITLVDLVKRDLYITPGQIKSLETEEK